MDGDICKMHPCLLNPRHRRQTTLLSNTLAILAFLLVLYPPVSHSQCIEDCFPPIGNLATGRTVQTNSQCSAGDSFCIHGTSDCNNTCNPSLYSIASINDGNNGTAWISTIGPNGTQTTLQLDFEAPILFYSMNMLWKSTRPRSMVLERSSDNGFNWEAYRYYSSSCLSDFALMPEEAIPGTNFNSTDAICTAGQSAIIPNTNGEVSFSTSEHLPEDTSERVSTEYRLITNLRVRLLGQFNLGSDTGFQYYSVGEWVVNGRCMCNGQATMCAPAPGEALATDKVYSGCMCENNTEGIHCQRCQTGFNNIPWSPGTACERCECNGHATDCTSMNLEEGVQCIDCANNTEGNRCQFCKTGFYQNTSLLLNDPNICIDCGCDVAGITDNGECSETGQCNCKLNVTGLQCSECAQGYWNLSTDNEHGCEECVCDPRGTQQSRSDPTLLLCDQVTGLCECQDNVGGDMCNICDDGYYSLDDGCLPCDCNVAGSTSAVCDKDSPDGQCPCLPNVDTPTCTLPLPGYYFRYIDHELFEAEEAEISEGNNPVYPEPGSSVEYSGRGLVVFSQSGTITFTVQVPRDYRYDIILRHQQSSADEDLVSVFIESQSPVEFDLHCSPINTTTSSFYVLQPSSSEPGYLIVDTGLCMVAGVAYSVHVEYTTFSPQGWMLDSLLLLPDFSSQSVYYAEQVASGDSSLLESCIPHSVALAGMREECRDIVFSLSVEFYGQVFECNCSSSVGANGSVICATYGGQCSCLEGVMGLQCDVCMNGWFNLSTTGCEACDCDVEGSSSAVCDIYTGQCNCRPNVEGRRCDRCIQGYFNLTSTGCSNCNCSEFSTSIQCSELGQCPCINSVGGATCDQCLPEHYNISTIGCTACNCSSVGVRSSSNNCDPVSGQCPCIGNTIGMDCSQCPAGYFETDSPHTDVCIRCVCSNKTDECSDDSENYQAAAIQSNFSQLCALNPVDCNDGWQLLTIHGDIAAPFGPSDANGLGYILLNNDIPMLYAPEKFLGNQQASYGLDFSVFISLSNATGLKTPTIIRLESALQDPLVGAFQVMLLQQENTFNTIVTYTIPLVEDYWHKDTLTGPSVTSSQLYSALSNLTQLSFSAEYRQDFIEFVYVQMVMLQTRVPLDTQPTADLILLDTQFPVELCACPVEYTGSSCQLCAQGYTRPSRNVSDPCIECNCNNLSLSCDSDTAVCINCTGNSEGDNCESCQPGYYGDPTRGIPCLPCQCPTLERSFSPTCFLDSDLNATCNNCSTGYTGRNCETCMAGFYGDPKIGQCITCECNGNVDPALGPICDTTTGVCLNCLNYTTGFECESCLPQYYGDPPSGVPCRPCDCHPNGTLGHCDTLFGTCVCANDNVLGELCDECRDGYWGLSQGLPCVPCDCCSNGSNSQICDKETGRCDCHMNVGSDEDDKCCTCTPGYFDFTPDGCQACNCSELAVSEECDIITGQCSCQEGAIGFKCNDCAFGFVGTVPDCEECHPCFFQWYDRIQDLSEKIEILADRARLLLEANYNGFTIESIEADIQDLLDQLATVNTTLQNITPDNSSIQLLQDIYSKIKTRINELDERTRDIKYQLYIAEEMLARTAEFDGTINETSVNEMIQQIASDNATVAGLVMSAQVFLNELEQDQMQALSNWTYINEVESRIEDLLTNLSSADSDIDRVEELLEDFEIDRQALHMNLSMLSDKAHYLQSQLVSLNISLVNVSYDSREAYDNVQRLISELTALRSLTDKLLNLTQQLNYSVESTRAASQQLMQSTNNLVNIYNVTQAAYQGVVQDVDTGIYDIEQLKTQLESIKDLTQQIFNTSLPSLEYVQELARSINSSILPDEQVQGIVANATESYEIAQQILELARNASDAVRITQSLINELNSDLNTTKVTQERVEMALSQLRDHIANTTQELEQAGRLAGSVNYTHNEVESIVEATNSVVESTTETAMELRNRSLRLKYQASSDRQRSEMNANDANDIVNKFEELQEEVERRYNQSIQDVLAANSSLTIAQQLHNDTNQVTVQELKDLIREYELERQNIDNLREMAYVLKEEIHNLTSTFIQEAQTLNECYKTP